MVRSEDPPGKHKHLRFEMKCDKKMQLLYPILLDFPGVKSIVRHEGGTNGGKDKFKEHPHFHVWFESETAITNQTVRNWLNKIPQFVDLEVKSQAMWAFKNHDSFENWCAYVIKNNTYTVLLTHSTLEKIIKETAENTPVVVRKGDTIEHIGAYQEPPLAGTQKPRKSRAMRVQFVEWLEQNLKWEKCQTITPDNSDEMRSIIEDELCEYWEMAFAFNQAVQMVNHAHWIFANIPERIIIRSKFRSAMRKSNYLV